MANDNELIRDLRAAAYSGQTVNAELRFGKKVIPVQVSIPEFRLSEDPGAPKILGHDFTVRAEFHLDEDVRDEG